MSNVFDNNCYYKYIHILWTSEQKFTTNIVKLFYDDNGFNVDEHLFVTPYKELSDALAEYNNVKFLQLKDPQDGNLVNICCEHCDWLIVHDMCKPIQTTKFYKENYKKIIWRTWGNDAGYIYRLNQPIRNMIKFVLNQYLKKIYRSFHVVGCANIVDDIDIKNKFGDLNIFRMPYCNKENYDLLCGVKASFSERKAEEPLKVMVGHFGFLDDNHLIALKQLKKFKEQNVIFYFPVSYGNSKQIKIIKKQAKKYLGDKVVFVEDFMPFKEYAEFIGSMDIGILAGTRSYALGNVSLLAFMGKKIFLNRKGVIREAFVKENAPHFCVDEISEMSFEEFSQKINYEYNDVKAFVTREMKDSVSEWIKLFDYLDSCKDM